MTCSNDIKILSSLETEFINKYKPPLNWTKVISPIRKITPSEIALQQSLKQLAKLNTMIFGFDPIADEEPPTLVAKKFSQIHSCGTAFPACSSMSFYLPQRHREHREDNNRYLNTA